MSKKDKSDYVVKWDEPIQVQVYYQAEWQWFDAEVLFIQGDSVVISWKEKGVNQYTILHPERTKDVRNKPVERKVPPESRVDFTKPIELYYPAEEGDPDCAVTYPCEYVGSVHECSKNFPSWFVCRDLTPVEYYPDGEPMWSQECNLFLVRGDGKTDVFGAQVRNVEEETEKPKLVFPLEEGCVYKVARGDRLILSQTYPGEDRKEQLKATGFIRPSEIDMKTGKCVGMRKFDLVEGPLKNEDWFDNVRV